MFQAVLQTLCEVAPLSYLICACSQVYVISAQQTNPAYDLVDHVYALQELQYSLAYVIDLNITKTENIAVIWRSERVLVKLCRINHHSKTLYLVTFKR